MRLPFRPWLTVSDILSRTVSELSQLIVQILDTAFLPRCRVQTRSGDQGRIQTFRLGEGHEAPRSRGAGAMIEAPRGVGFRRGCVSPSPIGWGLGRGLCPSPEFFLNFLARNGAYICWHIFWHDYPCSSQGLYSKRKRKSSQLSDE